MNSKMFGSFFCFVVVMWCCSHAAQFRQMMVKNLWINEVCEVLSNLCNFKTDFDDYNKQKRAVSGSSGLFPFPRVGRSDPSMFEYDSPYSFGPYENYDGELNERKRGKNAPDNLKLSTIEMRRQDKRQGLVPFPRVGRSSSDGFNPRFWQHDNKRSMQAQNSANGGNGMWFGPRWEISHSQRSLFFKIFLKSEKKLTESENNQFLSHFIKQIRQTSSS